MTSITVRPATAADIAAYARNLPRPATMRALVAQDADGDLLALGGIGLAQGRWFAFLDLKPAMRPHKMTIARSALRFLEACRADGIRYIYAKADRSEPGAVRWLTRMGFTPCPDTILYRWSRD